MIGAFGGCWLGNIIKKLTLSLTFKFKELEPTFPSFQGILVPVENKDSNARESAK